MVAWPFDGKALPRSGGEKSLDSQFKFVAEACLELFELLEEYAPIWYTEQHHKRALKCVANPASQSVVRARLGTAPRVSALQVRHSAERELSSNGSPVPLLQHSLRTVERRICSQPTHVSRILSPPVN